MDPPPPPMAPPPARPVAPGAEAAGSRWAARLTPALLDEAAPTPLYHQIYLALRRIIREGAFGEDVLLPGEQALAALFAVSRITVKRALNELAADRLVSRHRGRGTLIIGRPTPPVVRSSFDGLLDSLREMGLVTRIELLETSQATAGAAGVAARMGVAAETPLQRVVRRRLLEGEPLSYLVTYTPQAIAARYGERDLADTPFLTLLERADAAPVEAEQWITAAAAEPKVAQALDVDAAAPLLRIERVMRGADGRTVQLIEGYYRPDRFQYHVRDDGFRGRSGNRRAADDS